MSAIFLMDIIFKCSKVKIFFKIEVVKSKKINHKNCVRKLKSNWFSLSTVEQKFYEVGFEVFCVKLMLGGTICFSADSTRRYLSLACKPSLALFGAVFAPPGNCTFEKTVLFGD